MQMEEKRRAHEAKMAEEKAARLAERRARKELLKNETKAQRIERRQKERAEKIALKKQKRGTGIQPSNWSAATPG